MQSYKWMSALLIAIVGTGMLIQPARAQSTSSVPQAQAVYGGTVGVIKAVPLAGTTNTTRIFISMDSPNSVFYADADYSSGGLLGTNFAFAVVPDLDAVGNHGTPAWIAVHAQSDRLYVADDEDGLLSCTTASNSLVTNIASGIAYVLIESNALFAASGGGVPETEDSLYFGTLDASGTLTLGAGSPLTSLGFYGSQRMAVHPVTDLLYILCSGNNVTTALYKSSATYDAVSAGTTFAAVSLPTNVTDFTGGTLQFAIAPSGRLFIGGFASGTNGLSIVYSDDDGTSWTTVTIGGGGAGVGSGLNIVPNGSSNAYEVYYGSEVSSNSGAVGSWTSMPRGNQHAIASHVNSGCVAIDPLYANIIYFTTDKGFGGSTNNAMAMFELNNGLLAVQINDLDMSASKDIAWLASKAGVRRATNFNTTPIWTDGEFPNAIVSSIAMDPADASGLTAYAGSALGVYKTTTGGGTNESDWNRVLNVQDGPGVTNGISDGACRAIALDGNAVYAGFQGYDTGGTQAEGRLYMSPDNGTTWSNIMSGINVNNIIVNDESGTPAVYVAVSKLNSVDDGGIYRFVAGAGIVRDLTNSVNIRDLALDASGGIYASGTIPNSSFGHDVKVYYKALAAAAWSDLTTSGLPTGITDSDFFSREGGPVITVGQDIATNDIPILAVTRTLYYLPLGGSSWVSLYVYPNGTQVRMLYWDELLVGTSIGLYGQDVQMTPASCNTLMTGDYDGDSKADPALYRADTGNWYVKLSASGYGLVTLSFGGAGYQAVNGDFDGDGKADPAVYQAITGTWYVQLSGGGYTVVTLTDFGGVDYAAVTGDYDGDGLTDPAICGTASGDWQVAMSSLNYGLASASGFGGTGYTTVQENYDSDNRFDAAVYNNTNGNWTVLMSAQNYITATLWGFGGTGYTPVMGDFDGDGLADPAIYQESTGDWQVKLSGQQYATATLDGFGGSGTIVAAADYDGDGQADPIYLDESTGIWHVKLSASGYAEATADSGYTP